MTTLWLTPDAEANALLDRDPLALLLGMLLDQQFPMEAAFGGPWKLRERLGHLDVHTLAEMDLDELTAAMRIPPVVHRYPASMAGRVQALCRHLVDEHEGRVESLWEGVGTGAELLGRLKALPGFGDQKARIFLALLGKQRGIRPKGWREAAGAYGEERVYRSVADVVSEDALLKVRAYKKEQKAAAKAAKG